LLIESFGALLRVPLGFEPSGLVTMRLFLSPANYGEGDSRGALYLDQVLQRVGALPGVKFAAVVDSPPLGGGASTDFVLVGRPAPNPGDEPSADIHMVSSGYFQTMGIPLERGRAFTERDSAGAPRVMVISETMARQFWPGADPIGQKVTMKDWGPDLTGTIVGVVGDVKLDGLEQSTRSAIYWPSKQFFSLFSTLVVRTDVASQAIVPAIKAAIWSVNPDQTIASAETMESAVSEQFAPRRFNLALLGAFAGLALLLAALGVYGVLVQSVEQRTREIGVRMALGAQRSDVLRLVISQGLKMSLLGIAAGLACAWASMHLMASLLFGVAPRDPLTFAAAAVLLTVIALLACWVPARRATRVDPIVALRYE
jgi:putative ABC transport system permease protein